MSVKFFGQFLLEKNIIKPEELLEAVKYQESHNPRFGEYAQSKGYITKQDIVTILNEQKRIDMQFGELAMKLNILTADKVQEILTLQKNDHILIGQALAQKGFITTETLERELALFKQDQSQYITGEVIIPAGVDNPEVIRDFVDMTRKMIRRVANLTAKADSGVLGLSELHQNDVTVRVHLYGDIIYDYIISTTLSISTKLASGIMGEDAANEPREIIIDGVKEFCNIVCGNIIAKMAKMGKTVNISAPEEIAFSAHSSSTARSKKAVCFTFASPEGDISLILV